MALKEQLNKFNKQQEKCQSTLSSIASSRERSGTSSRQPVPLPAAITQKKPDAAPVQFSKNTEQLQYINSIKKSPVGAQIKRVIDLLFETRLALTPEQIKERCHVDMHSNKAVFDSLSKNPKAHYDGRRFSYKATHDVKDKSQLRSLVYKYLDGIAVVDLKDAYPNVMEDLKALSESKDIFLISNSQEDIAYPNDFKCEIAVDDEFKSLFRDIDIPNDMLDVEKELLKIGLKPATNTAERRAAAQIHGISNKSKDKKKKKQEISKRTKLTNAHLPELFKSLNASSSRN
ncbi:PREDICTED: transcription initiation factor IIE subunit beta [Camelina sativa]|uniref:Transcription initiation factor IIE subunit beta n=1 Tax=Camelina sativa TaxID=90675 RepID=A0ABM0U135_CAMSA|nr:PREDICTED: transcription initiation factor IIE subunit beta [Camelina sativa]XP_010434297.1 PREDICTED: transcription initiation factor IIE subunit beta [Camelina sativa]XP_010439589.1 PREDICTED: transcription initiation factor IIE subunit beta [Camelina sativa]XP_010439590.1 PREDICTED: transcription initiation factor IIE subunit beta [Camelina sativa]XP_019087007.1 PREDICTED: transcription initiation factor IIE subunit beta [Camelina sativa]